MKGYKTALFAALAIAGIAASSANAIPYRHHWECVPFAREVSGIQLFGNALTWWGQADGRYARGHAPKVGAVLAFKPHGSMRMGHVAAVSHVVDDRTIKLTHANWSLINGRRGQVERNVTAIDVSDSGDWSRVKVWFAPLHDLGKTAWPTHGFIYPGAANPKGNTQPLSAQEETRFAQAKPTGRLDGLEKFLKKVKERD